MEGMNATPADREMRPQAWHRTNLLRVMAGLSNLRGGQDGCYLVAGCDLAQGTNISQPQCIHLWSYIYLSGFKD